MFDQILNFLFRRKLLKNQAMLKYYYIILKWKSKSKCFVEKHLQIDKECDMFIHAYRLRIKYSQSII